MCAKLNIGIGDEVLPKYINVSKSEKKSTEVKHDYDITPWPWESSFFEEIRIVGVLEKVKNFVQVMEEIHRIGKPGCIVKIRVPYFHSSSGSSDPLNLRRFTFASFDYLTKERNQDPEREGFGYDYTDKFFEIKQIRSEPTKIGRFIPNWKYPARFFARNKFIGNRDAISHFIGELNETLYFELKIVKEG